MRVPLRTCGVENGGKQFTGAWGNVCFWTTDKVAQLHWAAARAKNSKHMTSVVYGTGLETKE